MQSHICVVNMITSIRPTKHCQMQLHVSEGQFDEHDEDVKVIDATFFHRHIDPRDRVNQMMLYRLTGSPL
jgi:hypothetical protein